MHPHVNLNHDDRTNAYGAQEFQFKIAPKKQNNMELDSHLLFYVYWSLLRTWNLYFFAMQNIALWN
jgi:hypothetical protein